MSEPDVPGGRASLHRSPAGQSRPSHPRLRRCSARPSSQSQSGTRPAPPTIAWPWPVSERPWVLSLPLPLHLLHSRPGTPLNRLRPLRVPNCTRRLLEPTRSCRDPRIPPLPRLLTGRALLGAFCASLLLALSLVHHLCFSLIGQLRLGIGRFPTDPAHPRLYDWREGRRSETGIGCLLRQSWPCWLRPLVLFFLEISTFPIGLADSMTETPSDKKNFNWAEICQHSALIGVNHCPSKGSVGFMGVRGHDHPLQFAPAAAGRLTASLFHLLWSCGGFTPPQRQKASVSPVRRARGVLSRWG